MNKLERNDKKVEARNLRITTELSLKQIAYALGVHCCTVGEWCKDISSSKKQNFKNKYIGKKFSRLTIIDYISGQPNKNNCKCLCDCGKIKWINLRNLTRNKTPVRSCGCLRQERIATVELFIKKAISIWGNKYDYSNIKFVNNNTKINIYCNTCNLYFSQKPYNHISNKNHCHNGCPRCAGNLVKTTEEFVKEAQKVHNNQYDYSEVNYKNSSTKIKIICKKCQKFFLRTPKSHLTRKNQCDCHRKSKIHLKDGTILDSLIEVYYYLSFIKSGVQVKYHGMYGNELGRRLYDFYIPIENKYIEVTGYNKNNYYYITGKHWISYLRNIVIKRRYTRKIGAKFEFIQCKYLKVSQYKYIKSEIRKESQI